MELEFVLVGTEDEALSVLWTEPSLRLGRCWSGKELVRVAEPKTRRKKPGRSFGASWAEGCLERDEFMDAEELVGGWSSIEGDWARMLDCRTNSRAWSRMLCGMSELFVEACSLVAFAFDGPPGTLGSGQWTS